MPPMVLRRRMSRLTPENGKVGGLRPGRPLVVGLDVQRADVERAYLPGQPPAGQNRHDVAALQPDTPAEKQCGHPGAAQTAAPREVEVPATFEKELAFLREEQAEPRQVHLLLIDFDLGEVGVVGEVGRQVLRHPVLHVEPELPVQPVPCRGIGVEVGGHASDAIRLDLDLATPGRDLDTDKRPGLRDAPQPGNHAVPARGRDRQRRQIRRLGPAPDDTPQLDAPHLGRCGSVA